MIIIIQSNYDVFDQEGVPQRRSRTERENFQFNSVGEDTRDDQGFAGGGDDVDDPVDNHADIENYEYEDNQIAIQGSGSAKEEEEANSGSGFSSSAATRVQETSKVLQVRVEIIIIIIIIIYLSLQLLLL